MVNGNFVSNFHEIKKEEIPTFREEKVSHFTFINILLYKRSFSNPISFCMIIYPRRKNFVDQRVFDREKKPTNQLHQKRSILLTGLI